MTRAEYKAILSEDFLLLFGYKKAKFYYAAQKRYKPLVEFMKEQRPGVAVTLHHLDDTCTDYELWFPVFPMYTDQHTSYHNSIMSDGVKKKISIAKMGHEVTEETRQKIREKRALQVMVPYTEERRKKLSNSLKGQKHRPYTQEERKAASDRTKKCRHFNNGVKSVFVPECPDGFWPGRLIKKGVAA